MVRAELQQLRSRADKAALEMERANREAARLVRDARENVLRVEAKTLRLEEQIKWLTSQE
jgi:hypothetical protein